MSIYIPSVYTHIGDVMCKFVFLLFTFTSTNIYIYIYIYPRDNLAYRHISSHKLRSNRLFATKFQPLKPYFSEYV